jgi:hypothetical protein
MLTPEGVDYLKTHWNKHVPWGNNWLKEYRFKGGRYFVGISYQTPNPLATYLDSAVQSWLRSEEVMAHYEKAMCGSWGVSHSLEKNLNMESFLLNDLGGRTILSYRLVALPSNCGGRVLTGCSMGFDHTKHPEFSEICARLVMLHLTFVAHKSLVFLQATRSSRGLLRLIDMMRLKPVDMGCYNVYTDNQYTMAFITPFMKRGEKFNDYKA